MRQPSGKTRSSSVFSVCISTQRFEVSRDGPLLFLYINVCTYECFKDMPFLVETVAGCLSKRLRFSQDKFEPVTSGSFLFVMGAGRGTVLERSVCSQDTRVWSHWLEWLETVVPWLKECHRRETVTTPLLRCSQNPHAPQSFSSRLVLARLGAGLMVLLPTPPRPSISPLWHIYVCSF